MIARYRVLLSTPGVGRLLVSSVAGRLPVGMFSLAILLFVHSQTGSFLAAGLAVGAFTVGGAVVGPPLGALVDRVGQTPVLVPAASLQATLLVALVLVTQAGAPVAGVVALAAVAGAALPPIAGCVRALWPEVVSGEQLDTLYALDATTQETIWTLGPLLVGSVAGLVSPAAAVLVCAALTVCGTGYFAASALSRQWRARRRERARGALFASSDLRLLLYSVALAGTVIGAVEVGLTALAVQQGARWSSGPLLALFSVGSMTGGLLYSARSWTLPLGRRYAMLLSAMAVAVAPLIVVHSLAAAFALSVLAGLALAPAISCQLSLVGALSPEGTVTEAFTWHRTATVAGMACGSAVGGSLIDAQGPGAAFALGCASMAAAVAVVVAGRRRIEPQKKGVPAERPLPAAVPAVEPPARAQANGSLAGGRRLESAAAEAPVEQADVSVTRTSGIDGLVPFTLAAEAVALAADAVALAADVPTGGWAPPPVTGRPRPFTLAAEAVALAADAVAQTTEEAAQSAA